MNNADVACLYSFCYNIEIVHNISYKEAQISVWNWKVFAVIPESCKVTFTTWLYIFFKLCQTEQVVWMVNKSNTIAYPPTQQWHQITDHWKISAVPYSLSDSQGVKFCFCKNITEGWWDDEWQIQHFQLYHSEFAFAAIPVKQHLGRGVDLV